MDFPAAIHEVLSNSLPAQFAIRKITETRFEIEEHSPENKISNEREEGYYSIAQINLENGYSDVWRVRVMTRPEKDRFASNFSDASCAASYIEGVVAALTK